MRAIFTAFCIITFCGTSLPAQWRNIGPGGGGWYPTLAVSPHDSQVIYAGCDVGGFYRSLDAGRTWQIHNQGLRDYYVEVIAPHPREAKVIFVGTEGGIHRSIDGGETWQLLTDGFPPRQRWSFSAPISAIAFDPADANIVYAGIGRPRWNKDGRGTIYRSVDGGSHWAIANSAADNGMDAKAIIRDIAVHPKTGALFAATDRGLYRSDDRAATWRHTDNGLPATRIGRFSICRGKPDVLYISIISPAGQTPWQGGVYRSNDGGATWAACNSGLGNRVGNPGQAEQMTSNVDRILVHPDNPDIAYAGDAAWVTAGVYRTVDGGKSWQLVTRNMDRGWITAWGPSVMGMTMDPSRPDTLYFSTSGQIYRTEDRGEKWQYIYTRRAIAPAGAPSPKSGWWSTTGAEVTCLNSIAVHPQDAQHLYLCYFDIGLLQSYDGGRTFAQSIEGMRYRGNTFCVAFDPANPRIVYAGTGEWSSNHGDVCKSEDGGWTWKVIGQPASGLPDGQTHHLLIDPASPPDARRIYASVDDSGLYASEDGGKTWKARNAGLTSKSVRSLLASADFRALYVLCPAESGSSVFRSDDRGLTWKAVGQGAWPDAKSLVISPSEPGRMYVAAREKTVSGKMSPGGVFASSDAGVTWTRVMEDSFTQSLAIDPANPQVIYAGGNDHPYHDDALGRGVLVSRDGGKTWADLSDPSLSVRKITCLTISPGAPRVIYAGTGGAGVFVRAIE